MAIKNLDSQLRALRSWTQTIIPSRIEATTREIASYALEKAMVYSPYDTGRFLASWRVSLSSELGQGSEPGRRSEGNATSESRAMSEAVIRTLKFGQTWYLGNAAPYATYVEYGGEYHPGYQITARVAQSVGGKFGRIEI